MFRELDRFRRTASLSKYFPALTLDLWDDSAHALTDQCAVKLRQLLQTSLAGPCAGEMMQENLLVKTLFFRMLANFGDIV